jgi:DNA polymerase alpha subunit A
MQLETQVRAIIGRLYAAWLVCDDQSCKNRTRMMSVYGRRCLRADCRGSMHYEVRCAASSHVLRLRSAQYADSKLYTQLLYFESLFDLTRLTTAPPSIQSLAASNEALLKAGRASVQRYLDRCGRRYVSLASLFSFCAVTER